MANEPSWLELLGSDHWHGLIDPLDVSLRKLILRCGDFCQATYDAFDNDANSKYCGSSRYGKKDFFKKACFDRPEDFEVHEFLYATANVETKLPFLQSRSREAWSRESNWIGYIAVSSDSTAKATGRREIYVVWRGTTRDFEWINVLEGQQASITNMLPKHKLKGNEKRDDDNPKVMFGWHTIYTSDDPKSPFNQTSVRDQLWTELKELLTKYKEEELSVVFTGHSLGASLSILSSFDVVINDICRVEGKDINIPVCAIVFGSPQVGNKAFRLRVEDLPNYRILHVKNELDLIPHYPSIVLGYDYIGDEIVIDTRKSNYLKDSKNTGDWHNLQALLHVVAGWNGKDKDFEFKVKRSVALVNKSCDYLQPECMVPASWWVEKNKGLVKREDGEWEMKAPDEEDVPQVPASQIKNKK